MRIRYPGRWARYVAECAGAPPADYPLGVDFATALRWVWRVRRWKYTFSANVSQSGTVTWTHADPSNPPPTVRSGPANVMASVARLLTLPAAATDPRLDESALLVQTVGIAGGWGSAYQSAAGYSANFSGQRDTSHTDTALTTSASYPFTNPGRSLSARYQLITAWQDPYFPYPGSVPASAPPLMYHSQATDLYYPRFLLYAQVTAVAGATVPVDGADQGVALAVATPAALTVRLPGFSGPLGSLLSDWQAAAASGVGVVAAYPGAVACSVQVDGTPLPGASLVLAGYGMAGSVSTVTRSVGGTVSDTHAGAFNAPTLSLSLQLSPAEYWPYTGKDGYALYDATTGAVVLTGPGGPVDPVLAPYP